jgi:predicted nucleotidyltransferase
MDSAYNKLTEMILTVAQALGEDLLKELAFVGGCTTGLMLTDNFSKEGVRYTDDVDLIVNVVGYPRWVEFQERLRSRGFRESIEDEVICRMRLGELKVDFMPDDETILHFSNRWYSQAFESAQPYELAEGVTIKLLTPTYFIATKLEAYLGRGNNDPQSSHDMEDILNLFDGCENIVQEIESASADVRNYIANQIGLLLVNYDFDYAVQATAKGDRDREKLIFERLESVRKIGERE